MKKIKTDEQKKLLINILEYLDKTCRENDINYTLVGGSLIGAIRHKDIIPWDDDIDIILMREEYERLVHILKKRNHNYYKLLTPDDNYYYPFPKIIDTRTILIENGNKQIKGYGVYLDIFCFHYVHDNPILRYLSYKKLTRYKKLLGYSVISDEKIRKQHNLIKKTGLIFCSHLPTRRLQKKYIKLCQGVNKSNYIVTNWPAYGYKKDILKASYMTNFERVPFNRIKASITKDYDDMLRITFGDYMKLPPKAQQVTNHNMKAYWK